MKPEPLDLSAIRHALAAHPRPRRPRNDYDAARRSRLTNDWASSILSFDQELRQAGTALRARSRELGRNDPNMAKFLRLVAKNVVGSEGFKLQSNVMLQRGGRPNAAVNRVIEDAFRRWGRRGLCTVDGQLSWIGLQNLAARTVAQDGELLIRYRFVDTAVNPFGFALQLIDPDLLDWDYHAVLSNRNVVRFGVEKNADGQPIAYHLFDRHPSEPALGPRLRYRVSAAEIRHVFLPIAIGQSRGVPWATPAMYRMNLLKGYEDAHTVAARVAACTMGSIERDLPKDGDGRPIYDGSDPEQSNALANNGEAIPAEAGMILPLAPGEKLGMFKPEFPAAAAPAFISSTKQEIAAGLDVAYMSISGDVGAANYSSARVGLLDERDTWAELQTWFIEEILEPVYSKWLEMAFLTQLRSLPGGLSESYDRPIFHPRAFPWVDPLKDSQAVELDLANGLTTPQRVLASMGYDFEETVQELADAIARLKELGIEPKFLNLGKTANPAPDAAAPPDPNAPDPNA